MEMYEELVKRLRDISNSDSNIKSNYIGLTMLQAANAIEELSKPRWIPVTERLPEIKEHHVSDDVIVYLSDGGLGFSALEENAFGQTWFECERINPDGESGYEVTHWLPLPEPPKEEQDG